MTQIFLEERTCPICKNVFEIPVLLSTNSSGAPDLDLRPPEMQRSTMHTWVCECPHCGYVSDNFENKTKVTHDFIQTDKYQSCDNINFKSNQAKIFYRQYLIAKNENNVENEFFALHHCAWACDDADDADNAVEIRSMAVKALDKLEINDTYDVMRADLLRRSHQYDRLIDEYSSKIFPEEIHNQVCTFQVIKSKEKDDSCYTVEDVVKNNM